MGAGGGIDAAAPVGHGDIAVKIRIVMFIVTWFNVDTTAKTVGRVIEKRVLLMDRMVGLPD
jgi:hypothetical protein